MFTVNRERQKQYRRDDGREFFSVTQVCDLLWPKSAPPEAMDRGAKLHLRFALLIASNAKPKSLCARPAPLLEYPSWCAAMDKWVADRDPQPILLEQPSFNEKEGFAGTADAKVRMVVNGVSEIILPDLKSGAESPTDRVQVKAYRTMKNYEDATKGLVLYIRNDGTYHEDWEPARPEDWAAFLHALNVLRWRVGR